MEQGKEFTIDINSGDRKISGQAGETLFQALERQKLYVPTACGGQGKCGLCRMRIHGEFLAEVTEAEIKLLSADDLAGGMRLACQTLIEGDLRVEMPKAYYSVGEYLVKIIEKRPLTRDILLVRCQAVEPRLIRVESGCWMQWVIPPYDGGKEPYLRSFSLASDPRNQRTLEFIIRRNPCGHGTAWIFDKAEIGETLMLRGPHGNFHLRSNEREAIFIAGGSGLSAIRSILLDMCTRKVSRRSRLFFGAVSRRDLYLTEEMQALESKLPDFRFIPALSAPLPEDQWEGETGLITEVVARYYQDCRDREAYLCGSPGMLDACIKVLQQRGMPRENIYFDKFVTSC
ncbi:MAG: 2Fe-2S iron-sulfur cluster binding domain-containing protein [Lentisphaeria bacterium]